MNKEQLFEEIDEIYSEWHGGELYIGTERTERIKEALNRAINFIPCCTELPNKMVIELSDEEMQIVSTDELIQMEKEAMEFDGFEGWIVKGKAAILK